MTGSCALAGWFVLVAAQAARPVEPTTAAPIKTALELQPAITRAELEAHVRFLASDELHGRSTGTPEAERAARYLADVLRRSGVEPAGDENSFLQLVPLERTRVESAQVTMTTRAGERVELEAGRDYEAPSVAVELADLEIVVARTAEDVPTKASERTALFVDLPGSARRRKMLENAGHPEGRGFGLLIQVGWSKPRDPSHADSSTPPHPVRGEAAGVPVLRVQADALERLRAGEFVRMSVRTDVARVPVRAWNVVGRISGVGREGAPELAREAVVFSAHYDHLPDARPAAADVAQDKAAGGSAGADEAPATAAPADEIDLIYNGADDDASGCAAVLELAGAFAAGPRPARTLVFLLATGEEIGLLGTHHYLDHPAVALADTVANLNYEMIGRPDELAGGTGRLWLTGWDRTNLGPAWNDAGLSIAADPRLEQGFFERSDNYAFVLRGIVGQSFSSYDLHPDYHQVDDEADRIDYGHMELAVRAAHAAAVLLAAGDLTPRWIEGRKPSSR